MVSSGVGDTGRVVGSRRDDFAEWVEPHLVSMAFLAARMVGASDRDDVVQEALTRAWRKRHTFDSSRGTARAWLLAIVADRASRLRQRRKPALPLPREEATAAVDGSSVDLERALDELAPRMRLAVDCVYFVGLSVAETAAVMGIAEGTVKSTLSDARARLRQVLEVS
jgi:RNA polymerase sigma-70 factor, ECF subfamily